MKAIDPALLKTIVESDPGQSGYLSLDLEPITPDTGFGVVLCRNFKEHDDGPFTESFEDRINAGFEYLANRLKDVPKPVKGPVQIYQWERIYKNCIPCVCLSSIACIDEPGKAVAVARVCYWTWVIDFQSGKRLDLAEVLARMEACGSIASLLGGGE